MTEGATRQEVGAARSLAEIDLTDLDHFTDGFPHQLFAIHRREAPVWWHEPTENTPDGEGFWSVATYAEANEVLRHPEIYSSERGGNRPYGGTLIQDLPVAGRVLNMMDDPRHARIRALVSRGLTPRMIHRVEDDARQRVRGLLDHVEDGVPFDFVREVAAELPMQMICLLLGVPAEDRHWLFEAVEPGFDFKGSRKSFELAYGASDAQQRMQGFGRELIEKKRRQPADDMLSIVVGARLDDADPPQLTDEELYAFFSLLFAAGSETTRNAIAGGLLALIERPDPLARLRADLSLVPTAIEEIVRWTTPSPSKRRTATCATKLRGTEIEAGDKVVIWEGSANRDEQTFERPMEFDITRAPNPHLGFGHGLHYCIGASLARLEIRVMLEELLPRFSHYRLVEPVEWTRSNRHTGIRHMVLELRRS
jgi:cytochrome P450